MEKYCRRCGKPIHFVRKPDGKYHVCETRKLTVVLPTGQVVSGWESHFAHCPHADRFRRENKPGR